MPVEATMFGAFAMGALFLLIGVCIGGSLVFKTKREPHESLFSMRRPQGEAYVLDPFDESGIAQQPLKPKGAPAGDEVDKGAETLDRMTSKFLEQVKMERAVAGEGEKAE
jgi:hypothetical protein